jgi:hypothetical protein
LPSGHGAQAEPPQSLSVSVPFSVPSMQLADWQTWLLHTALLQSPLTAHAFRSAHFVGHDWPQSVSGSLPFFTPSEHVGALHVIDDRLHTALRQSAEIMQSLPSAQGPQ